QQAREELLGQVFGFLGAVALAADVSVQRIPVRLAQRGQRAPGQRRVGILGGGDDGPAGGGKAGCPWRSRSRIGAGRHGLIVGQRFRRREGKTTGPKQNSARRQSAGRWLFRGAGAASIGRAHRFAALDGRQGAV